MEKKKIHPKIKSKLHPRSRHRERYDFKVLIKSCPDLAPFVHLNKYEDESIDFSNPVAVKMLNKSLLIHHYGLDYWDVPPNYLCPPIPGRADYIHYVADLLAENNNGEIPTGPKIKCLDVGVGANCIYPIIGIAEYDWSFVGSEVDPVAVNSVNKIITSNALLKGKVECRLQQNPKDIFKGIIQQDDYFDLVICNPPFHASLAEAQSSNRRKVSNLKGKTVKKPALNFGGQNNELWYEGGELAFIGNMISESKLFSGQCAWFTTLVSKEKHLNAFYKKLKRVGAMKVKTIPMGQGNKLSRVLSWRF